MLKEFLNQDIFNDKVEKETIRKGFGLGLLESGKMNTNVVALCADLTESTQMHLFKNEFPDRFVEVGVAEQNLASIASGMSAMNKIPVISSYAMFSPGRNWEQIRTTICYNNRKVVIAGSHAGISVGPDGGTHQAIEDLAITRVIPNMTVLSPCDIYEAKKATIYSIIECPNPVYIRLSREKTPIITKDNTKWNKNGIEVFWDSGDDIVIFVTGSLNYQAICSAKELTEIGYKIKVINVSKIKQIDTSFILAQIINSKLIVSIEEHQISGGLGSLLAEIISENNPKKIIRIGIDDKFGQSGKNEELLKHYKLDKDSIKERIISILN